MWWLCDHRACISLGWIVSTDAGCAGSRRIVVERAVWYEILTPGIIPAFSRCHWCVRMIPLSIRYNVRACHVPIYHYIIATVVHLVQRIIAVCVVVVWSQSLYLSRMKRQCGRWVCWSSTNSCWKSGLIWNTEILGVLQDVIVCVRIILPSIWYNVCACHSPVYHYITATAAYLVQRIITACVVVLWSKSLYLSRMNSQCGH